MALKKENGVADALLHALEKMLTPLVRVLMRYGVTYRAFGEVARRVFIDVATRDFAISGRKLSASRIAVLTGLSRREVARYRDQLLPYDRDDEDRVNRAARVIAGWRRDSDFHDGRGGPKSLRFDADEFSFMALVRRHAGDVPGRALLDELLRIGAVERLNDGRLRLVARAYVTGQPDSGAISILGTHVPELIGTINHNLEAGADDKFFQRRLFYTGIPLERAAEVRAVVEEHGQGLLERLHEEFERIDDQSNGGSEQGSDIGSGEDRSGKPTLRVVIGMHYFEEQEDD